MGQPGQVNRPFAALLEWGPGYESKVRTTFLTWLVLLGVACVWSLYATQGLTNSPVQETRSNTSSALVTDLERLEPPRDVPVRPSW